MAGGAAVVIFGIWLVSQVLAGDALERLNIVAAVVG